MRGSRCRFPPPPPHPNGEKGGPLEITLKVPGGGGAERAAQDGN